MVAVEIDLVGAYDAHHSLRSRGIGIAHGRPEECPRLRLPRSRSFRVHHFRGFDSLREIMASAIDVISETYLGGEDILFPDTRAVLNAEVSNLRTTADVYDPLTTHVPHGRHKLAHWSGEMLRQLHSLRQRHRVFEK